VKIFREVSRSPEFEKDLKKLVKRFRTLEDDLDVFINAGLKLYHKLNIDTGGILRLTGLGFDDPQVYKAKKFACKSLKGFGVKSGIRVIYAYHEKADRIELIEIYFKGDKETEDRERIARMYRARRRDR
jgi:hypothetical protein